MDAREGLSPPCRGLQPRASILGHRALRCQGGARTPAFRLTAGRLAVRPPGTETTYRDGDSNPGFRIEGPASCPLDDHGVSGALILLSYGESGLPFGRQVKLPSVDGRGRTCNLRLRRPAPSPLGHVDTDFNAASATEGTRTPHLRLDGPAPPLAELLRARQRARPTAPTPSRSRVEPRC